MKKVDIDALGRRAQHDLFIDYRVPTFSLTVRMDVTAIWSFYKRGGKLFDAMLYSVWKGMSSCDALRMRFDGNGVVLYDVVHPSFTVATDDKGSYVTCRIIPDDDYKVFSKNVRQGIEQAKKTKVAKFGDGRLDDIYFSCLPEVDFISLEQPVPGDPRFASIPMAAWGKFVKNGDRYEASLQIMAHHSLIDGVPLGRVFAEIQRQIDNFDGR